MSSTAQPHHGHRTVYHPLQSSDTCSSCQISKGNGENLKFCGGCSQKVYCSKECQTSDWPSHKKECKATDTIQLESFYPLLAYLAYLNHLMGMDFQTHPARVRKILSSPNPRDTEHLGFLPDWPNRNAIILGEPLTTHSFGSEGWWPTGLNDGVRRQVMDQILVEGNLLPVVLSICFSLASEMFTTAAGQLSGQYFGNRKIRLKYDKMPISDFGIAKGSVDVPREHQRVYFTQATKEVFPGQDPNDHYWIYFTTASGQTIFHDCGLYAFNYGLRVETDPYVIPGMDSIMPQLSGSAPSYFVHPKLRRLSLFGVDGSRIEKARFSVLRDPCIQDALRAYDPDLRFPPQSRIAMFDFMKKVSGRNCSTADQLIVIKSFTTNSRILRATLERKFYLRYPETPKLIFDAVDPEQVEGVAQFDGTDEEKRAATIALSETIKKYKKMHKKGEITDGALVEKYQEEMWKAGWTKI